MLGEKWSKPLNLFQHPPPLLLFLSFSFALLDSLSSSFVISRKQTSNTAAVSGDIQLLVCGSCTEQELCAQQSFWRPRVSSILFRNSLPLVDYTDEGVKTYSHTVVCKSLLQMNFYRSTHMHNDDDKGSCCHVIKGSKDFFYFFKQSYSANRNSTWSGDTTCTAV